MLRLGDNALRQARATHLFWARCDRPGLPYWESCLHFFLAERFRTCNNTQP
jgi:hypothetical protein